MAPLRFFFVARESIRFDEGKSSNTLRGAFGTIFQRIACAPQCPGANSCEWRTECPYARMFEPAASAAGPSGLADWPRPFVFRAMHLDGRTVAAGERFHFDLNLFDTKSPNIGYLVMTFAELAQEGLGSGRSRVDLTAVTRLNKCGDAGSVVYEAGSITAEDKAAPLALDLSASGEKVSRMRVRFLTPTELKSGDEMAARPEFGILAARVRDRISTLRELYGGGALAIDFRGFGERAALVKMTRCEIEGVEIRRRSSRTGQVHSIGGFVGEAEYEGDLGEFVPYVKVAKWTGVGRQTVWGKGEIAVETW